MDMTDQAIGSPRYGNPPRFDNLCGRTTDRVDGRELKPIAQARATFWNTDR